MKIYTSSTRNGSLTTSYSGKLKWKHGKVSWNFFPFGVLLMISRALRINSVLYVIIRHHVRAGIIIREKRSAFNRKQWRNRKGSMALSARWRRAKLRLAASDSSSRGVHGDHSDRNDEALSGGWILITVHPRAVVIDPCAWKARGNVNEKKCKPYWRLWTCVCAP